MAFLIYRLTCAASGKSYVVGRGLRAFIRDHNLITRHLKERGHSKGFYLLDRSTPAVTETALS